jgi:hypothetical protein
LVGCVGTLAKKSKFGSYFGTGAASNSRRLISYFGSLVDYLDFFDFSLSDSSPTDDDEEDDDTYLRFLCFFFSSDFFSSLI